MSTGLECDFFETQDAEWFYVLQDWDCPVGAWDWRDYSTCYGPFSSLESAQQHLRDNHANPGGYTIYEFEGELEEAQKKLIADAIKPYDPRRYR